MRAVVHDRYGPPEVLRLEDVPRPVPKEDEVLVRVRATTVTRSDAAWRAAHPFFSRFFTGVRRPKQRILGTEFAGEIAEVGPGVTGWKKGDRVLVDPINRVEGGLMGETMHGGLAELCRARAHQLVRIPDGVSYADAAALPCAYGTALRMMTTNGHVAKGEKVLILGASGGVGVCCLQIAKLAGALLTRRTSDLAIAIAGAAGQAWEVDDPRGDRWAMSVLMAPASRIAGSGLQKFQ